MLGQAEGEEAGRRSLTRCTILSCRVVVSLLNDDRSIAFTRHTGEGTLAVKTEIIVLG